MLPTMSEKEREEYRQMYKQTHHVSSVDKIPATAHFVVLQDESRSYPSSYENGDTDTCTYMEYIAFDNEEALRYWITREMKDTSCYRKTYKVFYVKPVSVVTHQTLEIQS